MITTRDAIKSLITTNYTTFLTTYTGYPFSIRAEDVGKSGSNKGGLGVYCDSQEYKWKSTGFREAKQTFRIEIYIDAGREIDSNDRGVDNEAWLWNRMEWIRDLLLGSANAMIIENTTLINHPLFIKASVLEGGVRQLSMTVSYKKRVAI